MGSAIVVPMTTEGRLRPTGAAEMTEATGAVLEKEEQGRRYSEKKSDRVEVAGAYCAGVGGTGA